MESLAPDGSVVLAGTAIDGPILFGGGTTVGHSAIAVPLPCTQAAARLVAVPVVEGAFRSPPLGKGHFVIRATAVARAGNDAQVVARIAR